MNKLNKLFSTIFALTLLVALPAGAAFADEYPLMAGQHTRIGTVTVTEDGNDLTVEFQIDDTDGGDWQLLTTQVLATDTLSKKQKRGAPGQFEYQHLLAADTKTDSFTIPQVNFVAFHADVQNLDDITGYMDGEGNINEEAGQDCPTLEEIAAALPEYTTMQIFGDGSGYYDVRIDLNGDGVRATDGSESFDWYCIDKTHNIGLGVYTVRVFSSYEALPDQIVNNGTGDNNVDNEDNLDLVNWVINNPGVPVSIDQKQQQDVIWALVDDDPRYDPENLDADERAVYDAAFANGEGFVPADGQNLAIVLQPVDTSDNSVGQVTIGQVTIGQVTFGSLGLECTDWDPVYNGETAWAIPEEGGSSFPKSNHWGQYSEYTVNN